MHTVPVNHLFWAARHNHWTGPENKNYQTLENPPTLDYKNLQIVTLEKREYRLRMFGF